METLSLSEIASITGGVVFGNGERRVNGVCAPGDCREDKLCVVWDRTALSKVPDNIPVLSERGTLSGRDGIEHGFPRAALADILSRFDTRSARPSGVHPSAVIGEGCSIGAEVYIGPCCVVSDRANIGDRTVLRANVFVGMDAVIGSDSRLEACAVIHDFVQIGNRVILHSGAVIGSEGFGHVPMSDGTWKKIPHIGVVIIEDDVEIGPNSTVDRATFGMTRVRRGSKLGSLLHIAHNCEIGEDCVIAGCGAIGGSVRIGHRSKIAGVVGIADHVAIGEGVTIAGRSGVTKDIKAGMTVSGFPAQDHGAENRFQASLRRVSYYSKRLKKLESLFASFAVQKPSGFEVFSDGSQLEGDGD
jgi:UDP-3-O-[3-hydroxymyristoyl] glucosamine N-acyltransferase